MLYAIYNSNEYCTIRLVLDCSNFIQPAGDEKRKKDGDTDLQSENGPLIKISTTWIQVSSMAINFILTDFLVYQCLIDYYEELLLPNLILFYSRICCTFLLA